jgi:hypothetical protein
MVRIKEESRGVKQGMQFDSWSVIGPPFSVGKEDLVVVAQCKCGRVDAVECRSLSRGRSTKCKACATRKCKTTHGDSRAGENRPLYHVWSNMIRRCNVPSLRSYPDYGGRGICVCEEWKRDYSAFKKWALMNGYSGGLQIDRINNDGNYEPSNCRWATPKVNVRNRRNNHLVSAFGEVKCLSEWSEDRRCCVSHVALRNRLQRGWNAERALTTPSQSPRQ